MAVLPGDMTADQLQQILDCSPALAQAWAGVLTAACALYGIDSPLRQAAFVGQCAHESEGFTQLEENLNYSPQGLLLTWPLHFNAATAAQYGHTDAHVADQQMIANIAYANRLGNGDVDSGDGWTYRGRGILQNTGKSAYAALSSELNLPLLALPDLLALPSTAAQAAGAFWRDNNLNALADSMNYTALTERINGGTIGLADRVALTHDALNVLQA